MAVARIDAKLPVCTTEVLLEKVAPWAFHTDEIKESIDSWKAKGEGLVEVGGFRNPAVN